MQILKDLKSSYPLSEIPSDLLKEVQGCLYFGGYLTPEQIDGIYGIKTQTAFNTFKKDVWLQDPDILGYSTAQKLLELVDKRLGTKEAQTTPDRVEPEKLGTKTGNSFTLPSGRVVWANEFMVPGIPLTWGETTKDCSRIPTTNKEVAAAIKLADTFGEVRSRFGSPLLISSGFRPNHPRDINRMVGGVSNSQHIYFKALDIIPANGDFRTLWKLLKESQFTGLGDGVSTGRGFYHADIREGDRIIFNY